MFLDSALCPQTLVIIPPLCRKKQASKMDWDPQNYRVN